MAQHRTTLLRYKRIIEITNQYYELGITTYSGVWRKYVYPIYPCSYNTYMRIINTPHIDSDIKASQQGKGRYSAKQLLLF